MKKTALILSILMLFSAFSGSFAEPKGVKQSELDSAALTADVYGLKVGTHDTVTFTADIEGSNVKSVSVYDDNDNFVTELYPNDEGVYTGSVELYADEVSRTEYHVEANGKSFGSHEIRCYEPLTDEKKNALQTTWDNVNDIRYSMEAENASQDKIYRAVYEYLLTDDEVASVWFEDDETINFETYSGIGNIFTIFEDDTMPGASVIDLARKPEELPRVLAEENTPAVYNESYVNNYIDSVDIAIYSAYYGADVNFTTRYYENALQASATLGGKVTGYYGEGKTYSSDGKRFSRCTLEAFKKFDQYGVVMIDSHGSNYDGGGCVCVRFPGEYDETDVLEGHLFVGNNAWVGLRGSYIKKYCPSLQNTIVYIGICHGMEAEHLYQPLLEAGAGVVMGYIESVTFTFDLDVVEDLYDVFLSDNPDTGRLYTASEAFERLNELNGGPIDPYSGAEFIWRGNGNMVMSKSHVPSESVRLSDESFDLYSNNTKRLEIISEPLYANPLICKWSSSDTSVVTVDEYGVVTAHNSGSAVITCVVTDMSDESAPKEYTLTGEVRVLGHMNVSNLIMSDNTVTLYMGTNYTLDAQVLPVYASDQAIEWTSSDTSVVKVDNGVLTPVSSGSASITAKTHEGGYTCGCAVYVVNSDINTAGNIKNGTINFTNWGLYPWTTENRDERFVLKASGRTNQTTYMSITPMQLKAGTVISFDWKVSCEPSNDYMLFNVNDKAVDEVANISGTTDWKTVTYTIPQDGSYSFRWGYHKNGSVDQGLDCGWLDNVDIKAPDASYTVNFKDYNGSTLESVTVKHGEAAKISTEPTRQGYTFVGWSGDVSEVRKNMDVTALYVNGTIEEQKLYTVKFYDKDGALLDTQTLYRGQDAEAPALREYEGFIFLRWNANFMNVNSNIEVHAVYGVIGDANSDGVLNTGDVTTLLRYIVGLTDSLGEDSDKICDVNGDGRINTGDAAMMLSLIVGR